MPTYFRRDDWVDMSIFGQAVPNVSVTYYVQPSLALAAVFSSDSGGAVSNPQTTDGFGHAIAYVSPGIYTIVYSGMQIQTLTLPDQVIGSGGSGSTITAFAGVPQGAIDGTNTTFTVVNGITPLTAFPTQITVTFNGVVQFLGLGATLTLSGGELKVTFANPPQPAVGGSPADTIYAQGFNVS